MPFGFGTSLSYMPQPQPAASPTPTPTPEQGPPAPGPEDAQALVQALLSSLETTKPTKHPELKTWQNIVGSIGDAIHAMAAVRAGGAPPPMGAFAASQRQQQMEYEKASQEATRQGVETRNRVRIGAFEEGLRAKREKEVAGIRATAAGKPVLKLVSTTDDSGRPVVKPMLWDPGTQTFSPVSTTEGQGTFDKYITPGTTPYVDPTTGKAQVGLVDKKTGQVRPATAGGQPVGAVPPEGAVKEATTGLALGEGLTRAERSFGEYVRQTSGLKRIGTSAALKLPFGIGANLDEFVISRTDPAGSNTARDLANVADMLLRLRSGAQINEQEYTRLRGLLPRLGENPATAVQRFASFRSELAQRLRTNMQLRPQMFNDQALQAAGFTREDILSITGSAAPAAPTGAKPSASEFVDQYLKEKAGAPQ